MLFICQTAPFPYSQQTVYAGSKNPRKLELWSTLCRSLGLTSCSKQGELLRLSRSFRSRSRQVLRLVIPPAQQVTVLRCFYHEEFFPCFLYFLCCNLWLLTYKSGVISFVAPIKQLTTTIATLFLLCLQARQIQFPQPLLTGSIPWTSWWLNNPLLDCHQHTWALGHKMEDAPSGETSELTKRNSHFPWPAAYQPANASHYLLAFITSRALHSPCTSPSGNVFCGAVAYLSNTNEKQLEISSDISMRAMKKLTQNYTANKFPIHLTKSYIGSTDLCCCFLLSSPSDE